MVPASRGKTGRPLPPDTVAGVDVTEALRLLGQAGYPDPLAATRDETAVLQRLIDALCDLSLHDGLTGLANARYFRAALQQETERVSRSGEACALLVLDLDHFKAINDTHGHPAGDLVLQTVARLLRDNLRPMDTVARYGGEEFAIILPNSLPTYAVQVAERLRSRIALEPIGVGPGLQVRATASIGIACSVPWTHPSPATLLDVADRNLYEAKARGRDRVWFEVRPSSALTHDEKAALFDLPT